MEGQGPRLAPLLNRQLGAAAFEALRRSLILPGWRPGQQLNLGQLTAQLGVSETPLKEALRRLAQQGLLEIRPRQGTFVRPLTERSLAQAIEARLLIEPWALGVIHERASAGDWARLDGIQASADALAARDGEAGTLDRYAAFTELDASFHLALVGACQNDSLAQLYESLGTHYLLARATCLHAPAQLPSTIRRAVDAHARILRAARSGRGEAATELLRAHVGRSFDRAIEVIRTHDGAI